MSSASCVEGRLGGKRGKKLKVIAVSGASGGHLFPAVSFLVSLKEKYRDAETVLALPLRSKLFYEGLSAGIRTKYLCISTVEAGCSYKNLIALLNLAKGWLESLKLILEFKPDVVVGFGTLCSVPLIMSAWFFRIRTVIHEQNVIPGRANRFLAKFAEKVAVSFSETKNYFWINKERIVFTGNLLRPQLKRIDRKEALAYFKFEEKFTLLVLGGSQGSQRINRYFIDAISALPEREALQVIHLSGEKERGLLDKSYSGLKVRARVFDFLEEMQYAYSCSDLVVCRAGATTISELSYFGLPAVIVPYPFAHKHQDANARVLEGMGVARVVDDSDLDAGILRQTLLGLLGHPDEIKLMRALYSGLKRATTNELFIDQALDFLRI